MLHCTSWFDYHYTAANGYDHIWLQNDACAYIHGVSSVRMCMVHSIVHSTPVYSKHYIICMLVSRDYLDIATSGVFPLSVSLKWQETEHKHTHTPCTCVQ